MLPEFDTIINLSNNGLTGMTPDKLYQELQQEFDDTIESIKRYGGFYIGRYETGNLSQSKFVIRQNNSDIVGKSWYSIYTKIKYLGLNQNVKTNMIWGYLWDETLQWLVDRGNKDYSKALNIYDLAGNAWEWTLEGSGTAGRSIRGGGYDMSCFYVPVTLRLNTVVPTYDYPNTRL